MARILLWNFILLLWWWNIFFCFSDDKITPGEFIAFNQTLVSDNGIFALGFFSPINSTSNLYVGIWYNNSPKRKVVWVANRENPLTDSFATFQISNDTNLTIMDSEKNILWSTNLTGLGSPGNDVAAVLQHTGNLVLTHDSSVLWQSFDYATDTFLPEMVVGFNEKKHTINQLASWKSSTDPSRGNFSFGFHPDTSFQLVTWQGTEKYWRNRPMVDYFYEQVLLQNSSSLGYFRVFASADSINWTFTVSDDSVRLRCTLDYLGQIQLVGWNDNTQDWVTYVSEPQYDCNKYGWCGLFGYCDNSEDVPACKCLQGFEPKVQSEWDSRNFTAGCGRKEELQCGIADKFVKLTNMKVPDNFVFMKKNLVECEDECRRNCSCKAYAYSTVTFNGTTTPRCLVWMGELLDTEYALKFFGGEDLYLRLAESGSSHINSKTRTIVSIVVVFSIVISVISLCLLWRFKTRIKGIFQNQSEGKISYGSSSGTYFPNGFPVSKENRVGDPERHTKPQIFNFENLVMATDNFSVSNTLGQGGFGIVYKGKLPDGQTIAVKRLSRGSTQGLEEYQNEVILIAKLQHRNLVRLLGWCIEREEKLLIYEYMPNKSLDYFLFDTTHETVLDWGKRFNIIKGIARALLYLHQDSRLRIIHRDLKASNILLDENMEPKVSDFGMARIFATNQDKVNTKRVVGTYGYMSPEYGMQGLFSVKSDVYSFGVLILEIVSGSRNYGFHLKMDFPSLLAYAWKLWSEGKANEFIYASMDKSCLFDEVQRCMYVGLLCVQDNADDRPNMSSVINMLENEVKAYSNIKQPLFTTLRMENIEIQSINDMTNTTVEVR